MAKKKKQIHVNIIDLQKYYQKDDLIIDAKLPEPKRADERRKNIFEQNEFVQNIEWRVLDEGSQNNKGNEPFNRRDDNRNKNTTFDRGHGKKGELSPHMGHRGKGRQNGTGGDEEDDMEFFNVRSKRDEDNLDFANLRNKREEDVDFGKFRNKRDQDLDFVTFRNKREEDVDFTNLRNRREDDMDPNNLRNKRDEDDLDFANVRTKRDEDDLDFANLRNKREENSVFSNVRTKRDEDDLDFANLRNKREEDAVFSNVRSKRDEDNLDFANLRNKREEDVDFGKFRNKRDEGVDFGKFRNKRDEDDLDFSNVRSKRDEDDVDFSNLRNKRNGDVSFGNFRGRRDDGVDFGNVRSKRDEAAREKASSTEKPYHLIRLEELRKRKRLQEKVNDSEIPTRENGDVLCEHQEEKPEESAKNEVEESAKNEAEEKAKNEAEEKAKNEAEEKAKKEAEEKAKKEAEEKANKEAEEKAKKEAEEKAKKEAEEKAKKEAEEKAKKEAEEKAKKEAEEKANKEAEEKVNKEAEEKITKEREAKDVQEKEAEETSPNAEKQPTPVDISKPADQAGEGTPKKKFVPKRVMMYQQEQKEREERNQKILEEQKKQREMKLQLLKSRSQGSSTFIPTAKLLHMEAQKGVGQNEIKKEVLGGAGTPSKAESLNRVESLSRAESLNRAESMSKVDPVGGSTPKMRPTSEQRKSATMLKRPGPMEQKNVKSIIEEIAEKTENAKIVEKLDIEELTKKRREELYRKQLDKITKRNEENEKYNRIYKHDVDTIKEFYLQVKNIIQHDHFITEEECVHLFSPLQTEECNYLESHVPFFVTITVFILSLTQKCADEVYLKKAANLRLLFLHLKERSKIENHDEYILNDVVKICDELKYPHLSEETSLIEATFDALLFTGVISKGSFVKWFDEDNSDSELKSKAMLQLIYWHKWLTDEEPENVEDEEEEDELEMEEAEDGEAKSEDDMKENLPKSYLFKKIKKKIF